MKVKTTLSLTATATQRLALPARVEFSKVVKALSATISVRTAKKEPSFTVLIKSVAKPLRISVSPVATKPVVPGTRFFLRALRDAELKSWNAHARFWAI